MPKQIVQEPLSDYERSLWEKHVKVLRNAARDRKAMRGSAVVGATKRELIAAIVKQEADDRHILDGTSPVKRNIDNTPGDFQKMATLMERAVRGAVRAELAAAASHA